MIGSGTEGEMGWPDLPGFSEPEGSAAVWWFYSPARWGGLGQKGGDYGGEPMSSRGKQRGF